MTTKSPLSLPTTPGDKPVPGSKFSRVVSVAMDSSNAVTISDGRDQLTAGR